MRGAWSFHCLLVALACPVPAQAIAATPCEGAVELTGIAGSIVAVGGLPSGQQWRACTWHVKPKTALNVISFRTSFANFGDQDYLALLDDHMNVMGTYSRGNPLPPVVEVRDTSGVSWRLNTQSSDTRIEMKYMGDGDADTTSNQISNTNLSVGVWVVVSLLLCLCCAWIPIGFCNHLYSRRAQRRIMESSAVRSHAAHIQSRSQQLAREQWVETQLEQLPQGTYQEQTGTLDQCCLCLEDFLAEDTLRILSCDHYFHKDCIDKWFQSRRFKARRCPLCNAQLAAQGCLPGSQSSPRNLPASMSNSANLPPPATSASSIGDLGHADSQSLPREIHPRQ